MRMFLKPDDGVYNRGLGWGNRERKVREISLRDCRGFPESGRGARSQAVATRGDEPFESGLRRQAMIATPMVKIVTAMICAVVRPTMLT
jgi:hypothetical protein